LESEARALAVEMVAAVRQVRELRTHAARAGHTDLLAVLVSVEKQLAAWSRDLVYDTLEQEEALRSQLKFTELEGHGLLTDVDLPF